jgi:hypothetical protein
MVAKNKGFVTGWMNYTYARSLNKVNVFPTVQQQINEGRPYAANYDRPNNFNFAVVIGQGKHHDFSFNFTYSSGRPFTIPEGFVKYYDSVFPYYQNRNNGRIPDYHRLDFAWNIYNPRMNDAKRFKGNWAFSIYNLYSAKNPYSVFFKADGAVLKPYKLVVFGATIPSLAYKFTFK